MSNCKDTAPVRLPVRHSIFLACVVACFAGARLSVARLNVPGYSALWEAAEVVVIATAVSSQETGAQLRVPVDGVSYVTTFMPGDSSNRASSVTEVVKDEDLELAEVLTRFEPLLVLKGTVGTNSEIVVRHYRETRVTNNREDTYFPMFDSQDANSPEEGTAAVSAGKSERGREYLLFLRLGREGGYELAAPLLLGGDSVRELSMVRRFPTPHQYLPPRKQHAEGKAEGRGRGEASGGCANGHGNEARFGDGKGDGGRRVVRRP